MPFSPEVKARMFTRCDRICCLCYKRCGTNIEAAHIVAEADAGTNTEDNGIPLCFDCHQEIGAYDDRHPRGNKFTPQELRARRDRVYEWVREGRFIEKQAHEPVPQQSVIAATRRRDFTVNLGLRAPEVGTPKFIFGPLVLTHLDARAKVRITDGHPADDERDSPTIAILDGTTFKGDFFVDWDWFVSGESDQCVCSGYHKADAEIGCNRLPSGAEFWVNPGRSHIIIIRGRGDDLKGREERALREAEQLWGRPLEHDGWDESGRFGDIAELYVQTKRDRR